MTTTRIAVVDPLPLYELGIVTALKAAGHLVEIPGDTVAWLSGRADGLVVVSVLSSTDWQLLRRLCAVGDQPVIAVLDGSNLSAGVRAVRSGARSVLSRTASAAELQRTVAATIEGQAVMPAAVLAQLLGDVDTDARAPSADQLVWLRRLAAGATVVRLAEEAGYSERAMFRLLHALYQRMGVTGRLEAIIRAQDAGWL